MDEVIVHIGAVITIRASALTDEASKTLQARLTHRNPEHERAMRFSKARARTIPQVLRFFDQLQGNIVIPRGALSLVRDVLRQHRLTPVYRTDGVVSRSEGCVAVSDLNVELRAYQLDALRAMVERRQGIIQMPCGSGKTTTAAAAMLSTGEPGLVLVHTHDIADQWAETIERLTFDRPRMVTGKDPRTFAALKPGEIAVAMVQTLTKKPARAEPLLGSVGAFITDECHHVPARTWRAVADRCPARFRWGLTATPDRSDGLGYVQHLLMGPTVYRITTTRLIEEGFLQSPTIIPVDSGWAPGEQHHRTTTRCPACNRSVKVPNPAAHRATGTPCAGCGFRCSSREPLEIGPLDYTRALSDASKDAGRLGLCRSLAVTAHNDGRSILVLVPRRPAVRAIACMLSDAGVPSVAVTGDTHKAERQERLERARTGEVRAVVATQLADEGLDLPALDCAINMSAGKSAGRARQRIGRTLRIDGKPPVVFEMVDGGKFLDQWRTRAAAYRSEYGAGCVVSETPLDPATAIAEFHRVRDATKREQDRATTGW